MAYLETAVEIAREAGALLANYFERRVAFELKGDFDLVTEADRASEKLIVERLRTHFPSHGIVAEEGGGHESPSEYRWFVDPLDGTTNFAHSFPMFNVTLGLEKAGEIVAGVIYDPIRQEMFTAERGAGAYLNNRRIRVSGAKRLEDSLASTGFPSRKRHQNVNIHFYHQMAMASHGVRRTGSAAIDLAYVASGPSRRVLGVRTQALGYGGGHAAGHRGGRRGQRYAWRRAPGCLVGHAAGRQRRAARTGARPVRRNLPRRVPPADSADFLLMTNTRPACLG